MDTRLFDVVPVAAEVMLGCAHAALILGDLHAAGGRAAWAGLRGTVNESRQNRVDQPTVVGVVVHIDTVGPGPA